MIQLKTPNEMKTKEIRELNNQEIKERMDAEKDNLVRLK
jgi:ribosomal protein L29